jgi:hypothetical protein
LRPPGQGPRQTETFATYIASLSEEDTAAEKYCKYINCRLGQLSVPALLDSGNVWEEDFDWEENWEENNGAAAAADNLYNYMEARNAAAANGDHGDAYCWGNDWNEAEDEEFNQINQDLQPLTISKIQTAKMGASLEIMGELKQKIYLQLGGCETRFRCQPVVVGGLTLDMNLSGPFLRQNKIDQIHSRDAIRINRHEVPLVTAGTRPAVQRAEVSSAPAYFAKKTILTPNSITMCSLRAPEII